ncbi:hypothetical protein KEM54_001208 [Ascosphaera aggregata]|nr:hypothetical protein KEM54_001208 [Ascosphaera aggregata]
MTAPFEVPGISLEDLWDFHARHFPVYTPASDFVKSVDYHDREEVAEEEYDDGLGYYADGAKRTLTDEQIHMFRHSEIQRALRKKEIRIGEQFEKDMLVGSETSGRLSAEVDVAVQAQQFKPQRGKKSGKKGKAGSGRSRRVAKRSQRGLVPKKPVQPPYNDISAGRRIIIYDD